MDQTRKNTEKKPLKILSKDTKSLKNKLKPIGICLYTNKKYHLLEDVMLWSIQLITDDIEYFDNENKDNWSDEKGKLLVCIRRNTQI